MFPLFPKFILYLIVIDALSMHSNLFFAASSFHLQFSIPNLAHKYMKKLKQFEIETIMDNGRGVGGVDEQPPNAKFEFTPTWIVALVSSIIVLMSFSLERGLHRLGRVHFPLLFFHYFEVPGLCVK